MTIPEYVERVRRLLMERGVVGNVADIEATLPLALVELGQRRAGSHRFQKDFTVAMAGGVADLSAQTAMLKDHIQLVKHPDLDGVEDYFSRLPNSADRQDLRVPRIPEFLWFYVLINDRIEAMKGDGQTLPSNTDVTVTADSIPTPDEVVDENDKAESVTIGASMYEAA